MTRFSFLRSALLTACAWVMPWRVPKKPLIFFGDEWQNIEQSVVAGFDPAFGYGDKSCCTIVKFHGDQEASDQVFGNFKRTSA